jgi:hypothetical protein
VVLTDFTDSAFASTLASANANSFIVEDDTSGVDITVEVESAHTTDIGEHAPATAARAKA